MGIREEQKEQRKNSILFCALELFVAKGYASTKITDIAKAASMSTGLLFHYFESKEKLYEELVEMGYQGTRYPMTLQCEKAVDYFEQFTEQLFWTMKEQPYVAKMFVLMAQAQRSEGIPQHIREISLKVDTIQEFVPIIKRGQEEGNIKEGDALCLSNAFWCSIQGIAEQYALHPQFILPEPSWIVDIVRKTENIVDREESL